MPNDNPRKGLGMQLYEKRILALEKEYSRARGAIKGLLSQLHDRPDTVDEKVVRTRLGLINGLARLARDESAFLARLGRLYDIMKFHEEFCRELERRDRNLAFEITETLDRRWNQE
jgi:hypothetical protein